MNQADIDALARRAEVVRSRVAVSSVIVRDRAVQLVKAGTEWDGLCPFHNDQHRGNFKVNDVKGIFKCFACGAGGDVIRYVQLRQGKSFMEVLRGFEAEQGIDFRDVRNSAKYDRLKAKREADALADAERRRKKALGVWLWAAPLKDTPVQDYMQHARGIDFAKLGRLPNALRYRHDCWNAERGVKMPAMVAAMVLNGVHVATHRTYLDYVRGRWVKADLEKPKMVLGDFAGAHIPLWKGAAGRMPLHQLPEGVTPWASEGIENGLSVALANPELRIVAAASIGNLGGFELGPATRTLGLLCDNDAPGSAADGQLEAVIARRQEAGIEVECIWPASGFKDFNDQLCGKRMEMA